MMTNDTIVAVATPPGRGAIAVIRVSGPDSVPVVDALFHGKRSISAASANRVMVGYFYQNEQHLELIDQVMVCKFVAPHSYTGEDVVEISCHGGVLIVQKIVETLLGHGLRTAEAGEFTKRAFLNGKMDLMQAEAVADMINAQTEMSLRQAQRQQNRELSRQLSVLKEELKRLLMLLEIELDFSEEEQFADRGELVEVIGRALKQIDNLAASYHYGKIVREGIHAVLVGKPNVGKSSILNRLLDEDRAIVSTLPGTTRDSIEESLDIQGYLFKVTDTAGLRRTNDQVEQLGVRRTFDALDKADVVLMVIDAAEGWDDEDEQTLKSVRTHQRRPVFLLVNKIDVKTFDVPKTWADRFDEILHISAQTGDGFRLLEQALVSLYQKYSEQQPIAINKTRHRKALLQAKDDLQHALLSLQSGLSAEFIALDMRNSLNHLGQITGEVTTEEILNDIFSNFCIGK